VSPLLVLGLFEFVRGALVIALLIVITGQIPRNISPKTSSTAIFLKELGKELLSLKIIYPGMFMQTVSIGILMPVIAVYARTVLGFNAPQFAYLLIGIGFVTISLLVPAGKLVDRWGNNWNRLCLYFSILEFVDGPGDFS